MGTIVFKTLGITFGIYFIVMLFVIINFYRNKRLSLSCTIRTSFVKVILCFAMGPWEIISSFAQPSANWWRKIITALIAIDLFLYYWDILHCKDIELKEIQ